MSYEQDRIHALEELACEQAMELSKLRKEYADTLQRNGDFCAAVTLAAFGHSDALTHDQIVCSLRELRRSTANVPLTGGQPPKGGSPC